MQALCHIVMHYAHVSVIVWWLELQPLICVVAQTC